MKRISLDNKETAMYTDELYTAFTKSSRLSISLDSLSYFNEEVENIISDCIRQNKFMDQDILDNIYSDTKTQIIAKAIFIDESKQGIYLVDEVNKNKITIPGGHISSVDILSNSKDPLIVLKNGLARELAEEYDRVLSCYTSLIEAGLFTLDNTLDRLGFKVVEQLKPMYLFNPNYIKTLTVYFPIIINQPITGNIFNKSIYVDRLEFIRASKRGILYDTYFEGIENDIRLTEYSFILDFIFNTDIF